MERLFQYMHNTRHCHCYRWNPYIFCILLRHTANWSNEICKICRFFGRWKTSGGHFDSRLGHVNSSAPIRRGVDCFTVSKLQRASSSFNHSPPLHCLLNKDEAFHTAAVLISWGWFLFHTAVCTNKLAECPYSQSRCANKQDRTPYSHSQLCAGRAAVWISQTKMAICTDSCVQQWVVSQGRCVNKHG